MLTPNNKFSFKKFITIARQLKGKTEKNLPISFNFQSFVWEDD